MKIRFWDFLKTFSRSVQMVPSHCLVTIIEDMIDDGPLVPPWSILTQFQRIQKVCLVYSSLVPPIICLVLRF